MKAWQFMNQKIQKDLLLNKIQQLETMKIQLYDKRIYSPLSKVRKFRERRKGGFQCIFKRNGPTLILASILIGLFFITSTFGVAIEDLKAPIKDLKDTLFGGWMWIPKIGAAVGGCILAVYNQSIMPLATGAAIGLGIHFYDLYIKAEGALI